MNNKVLVNPQNFNFNVDLFWSFQVLFVKGSVDDAFIFCEVADLRGISGPNGTFFFSSWWDLGSDFWVQMGIAVLEHLESSHW